MITNFYTLRELVRLWKQDLEGLTLGDVYSQNPNEVLLSFADPDAEWTLHVSVDPSFHYLFRTSDYSKAKSNVATLFKDGLGKEIARVRIAERDRMLYLHFASGGWIQIQMFGSRANVYLVDTAGNVIEAFKRNEERKGEHPPTARAAPAVESFDEFEDRWQPDRNSLEQALSYTLLLFDRNLAAETVHRADVSGDDPASCTEAERRALFQAAREVIDELASPDPVIYWIGAKADLFSLIPLRHRSEEEMERFDNLDTAVRVCVRNQLARRHFRAEYEPLVEQLEEQRDRLQRTIEQIAGQVEGSSRADRYQRWGHLLMTYASDIEPGREEVTVTDLMSEEHDEVTIPLETERTPIENAQYYYEKADRVRKERRDTLRRKEEMEDRLALCEKVLERLKNVDGLKEVKRFRREYDDELGELLGEEDQRGERVPFRQFRIDGYTIWVGRNANQNDQLLSQHSRKYDYWFHARKVPGAHVILRRPDRDKEPDPNVVRKAAQLAAYYSDARGSGLVPVQVTQRKYIHKPKGAPAGHVRVDREDVLMVEPAIPSRSSASG